MKQLCDAPWLCWVFAIFLVAMPLQGEIAVAVIGDSLADGIYLGMKLQPGLLRERGIRLQRWSRGGSGLTRSDQFDYAAWLRDSEELGKADFCAVEMGANDLQSIAAGNRKWIAIGSPAWKTEYTQHVINVGEILKARCGSIVWLLQPDYRNAYLHQYHSLINEVQSDGAKHFASAIFELQAVTDDYGADGIHFGKSACFLIAKSVVDMFAPWRSYNHPVCAGCHPPSKFVPADQPKLVRLHANPDRMGN